MRVHVEGELYIGGDQYGYTIEKKSVTQNGKNAGNEIFMPIGHYLTLTSCVGSLLKLKLSSCTATNLDELLDEVKLHRNFIEFQLIPKIKENMEMLQ